MIKFSARGTEFTLSHKLLQKYPDSMLCMLADNPNNFSIDKINDHIFVDINPANIDSIIDYYNFGNCDTISNFFAMMDMQYLGLIIENSKYNISPCMTHSLVNEKKSVCYNKYNGFYDIHSANNKVITIHMSSCGNDSLYKFIDSILHMENKNGDTYFCVNAYDNMVHIILSIIRDGLSMYYEYLTDFNDSPNILDCKAILDETQFDFGNYFNVSNFKCYGHSCGGNRSDWRKCSDCMSEYEGKLEGKITDFFCSSEPYDDTYEHNQTKLDMAKDIVKSLDGINKSINLLGNVIEHSIKNQTNSIQKDRIIKYLKLYNLCDDSVEIQLKNRLERKRY